MLFFKIKALCETFFCKEAVDEIKKETENFLEKMTVQGSVSVSDEGDGGSRIAITTDDARFLIGSGGEMIECLNALIRKIIQKKNPTAPRFFIDVNDYLQRRTDALKEDAKNFAKRVRLYRKEVVLDPMSRFERRIIHSTLSEYPDITTESIGLEPERRIVIKPFQ